MRAVLDANVVAAGVCWNGEGYLVLIKLARRRFQAFATADTLEETRETCERLIRERRPQHHALARLNWYCSRVRLVTPADLGKRRSRDPKDDPYLAAALGANADVLVSYDRDLLDLEKPFSVEIVRPARFFQLLQS